jgi:hypothetical protein
MSTNSKREGDWRGGFFFNLEERVVGKLNKCLLFQDELEVGRKEKDCLPIFFKIMWLEGKTIIHYSQKEGEV